MYYFHNLLGSKNSNEPNWRRKLHKHLVPPSKIDLSFKDNCKVLMYTKKNSSIEPRTLLFFLAHRCIIDHLISIFFDTGRFEKAF